MTDKESFVAFRGLFCGDCLIREGEVRHLSQELLRHLRAPKFRKLAEGLPRLSSKFSAFCEYGPCRGFLEAVVEHLDCRTPCTAGGGSNDCPIRLCCQDEGLCGCWMCDQFETRRTLA